MRRRAIALSVLSVTTLGGFTSAADAQTADDRFLGTRWNNTGPGFAQYSPEGNAVGSYGPGKTNWSIVAAGTAQYAPLPGQPAFPDFHFANSINVDQLLPTAPAGTVQAMIQYAMTTWSNLSSTGPGTGVSIAAAPVADGGGAVGAPAANADAGDMRFAVFEFPGVLDPLDGSPGIPGGSSSGGNKGRVGTPIDAVAHAFQPDTRGQALVLNIYSAIGGDIHFRPNLYNAAGNIQYPTGVDWYWDPSNPLHNPALPYGAGVGASPAIGPKQIDLLTVIFHEIGHALGLGHDVNAAADPMSVMNPTYTGPLAVPSARDIASIQTLYAPAPGAAGLVALAGILASRRRR